MDLYQQIFFITLTIAFGLLHFILFLYNRRLKSNLYFAIFAFLCAANTFFDFQVALAIGEEKELFYLRFHRAVMPYTSIFALLFIYSLFEHRIPKQFWLISCGLVTTGILAVFEPVGNFSYLLVFQIVVLIEAIRLMIVGIRRKEDGARIIAVGFAFLFAFSSYDTLMDFGVIAAIDDIQNGYPFGFVGLLISMSVYLARDFAKTNERMLTKERQAKELELKQRLLEAEDARKSKELEEARKLQLSMLPKCINEVEGLDVCFDMKPATEVGGDYYDYNVSEDGTLTVAIGDATGHGIKAGIMVSIIKSLFIGNAGQTDIPAFFEKSSKTIRQMGLGNLYMAMMIVRIKDGNLTCSSAGIPPLFIYRSATKSVEEFVIK
ncbi:MAG: SpoIIE family protein phosphatase, partial [Phycisphaerae bacterium]|nr:SpoIIE family protein phosphatase [Phycisphaerae bacterium]NIU11389.1 SpoIIE family protein phosphatase [Phycisphaerae bacterium]NIU59166.1 SpoIIE family protein phosphatase [Phycisphaerae bacterium]NIW95514.1 SpoIIE family protein phosphatase [Phycisphaerae bacterium]NIX26040.1 SpoIIE family protein phosphatase [Phycisphaerae bacterium]